MRDIMYVYFMWILYLLSLYFAVNWFLILFTKKDEKKDKTLKKYPWVTIIIPAHNEEKNIYTTIRNVLKIDYPNYKVIIIDDGSKDNTIKEIRRAIKGANIPIKVIRNKKNKGKAASMNKALRMIDTPFFITLDADSYPKKDSVKLLMKKMLSNDVVAVTSSILIANPKNFIAKLQWVEYFLMMLTTKILSSIHAQYVTPGPLTLFRTDVVKKIGGFDEKNLTEDQELAYRLQSKGYKITYEKHSIVYTYAMNSLKSLYKQRNRWSKGTLMNALKYRGMLFRSRYGELGWFQLPFNFLTYVFAFSILFSTYRFIFKPLYHFIHNLYLINFDVFNYFKSLSLSISLLDINIQTLFFSSLTITITLILLFLAFNEYKENPFKSGFLALIGYITIYSIIRSVFHIIAFIQYLTGRIQRW